MGVRTGAQRAPKREWRYIIGKAVWRGVLYACAVGITIVSLVPFVWTLSTSLKVGNQVMGLPPKLIPDPIFWQNYTAVFKGFGGYLPVGQWLWNTVYLTGLNLVGEVLFAAIAGFGFARIHFRLRNAMFITMLSNAIIPGMVRMLPRYLMFSRWGWTNSYWPLTIPRWFGGMFLTFLFRQYFVTIPRSLDHSAMVDGASRVGIFFRIILPLSKPILATAAILVFISNWNSFLGPFIYLHEMEKFTLGVGARYLTASAYSGATKEPLVTAYATIMAAPVITVFFFFQRYFVQGIRLSAAKE